MSLSVIKVENLSKQYRIGEREGYKTFREAIVNLVKAPFRRWNGFSLESEIGSAELVVGRNPESETIWALKDISFEVNQSEVVGIIGRNGAGKSTLLKILSKITEPTEGRVELRGRVGSLLEVGTGFHPELTGHENIYLYGAILGMDRWEVTRKFDEIVAFAEIEKFIDTPVKRYSSGMYTRLAFAVAAHLEPEILLVDEVLAVGDVVFQKKCLGKMDDVSKEGRTVLFVSHNMAAISNLCQKGILLDNGKIICQGNVNNVVNDYINLSKTPSFLPSIKSRSDRKGDGKLKFVGLFAQTRLRSNTKTLFSGEEVKFIAEYESNKGMPLRNVSVSIPFYNLMGQHMFMCWTRVANLDFEKIPPQGRFIIRIPKLPLLEGRYFLNLWCEVNGGLADWVKEALIIDVVEGDYFGTGKLTPKNHGGMLVEHMWSIEEH
jgi:lipopolysaccharide transport system ATP-binding protein